MRTKPVSTARNCNSGIRLVYGIRLVMKTWKSCTQAAVLGSIQSALQPYMLYNYRTVIFEFNGSCEEGYTLQWQHMCHAVRNRVVVPGRAGDGAAAQEELKGSDSVEKSTVLHPICNFQHAPIP